MSTHPILKLITLEAIEEFIASKSSDGKPSLNVIHFKSDWSEPCKQMTGILEELKADETLPDVLYAELNAEDFPEISMKFSIIAVPTTILFTSGKEVNRVNGLRKAQLTTAIKTYILNPKNNALDPVVLEKSVTKTQEVLDERLKKLINQHDIMVFMKGNQETPRCGFSRTLMDILTSTSLPFKTFDILEDDEVRQGLKTYSNWQTYPQVYVKGELIGGLDIIKELKESNELIDSLKGTTQ